MTYEKLQAAQWAWAKERFGPERSAMKALQPVSGVSEELGELAEAEEAGNASAVEDAIGDAVIYLCDLCNRMAWTLPEASRPSGRFLLMVHVGRLHHAVLKSAQGIRLNEDHEGNGSRAIAAIIWYLDTVAATWHLGDALSCALVAWDEVSKRSAGHAAIPNGATT